MAAEKWKTLYSESDAKFDHIVTVNVSDLATQVTWGTNPGQVIGVNDAIPDPYSMPGEQSRTSVRKALAYVGQKPGPFYY